MAMEENLGPQFAEHKELEGNIAHGRAFHGTYENLSAGDLVLPADHPDSKFSGAAYGGGDEAWATESLDDAKSFGPNVYEVEHLEDPSTTTTYPDDAVKRLSPDVRAQVVGKRHYSSTKGFRVIRKVE